MAIQYFNRASTTLAGAISSTATTANLASGSGALFPLSSGNTFKLTFIDAATGLLAEIVLVTAISGDTITMTRAQEGTSALAWNAGDLLNNLITAGYLNGTVQYPLVGSGFSTLVPFTSSSTWTVPANVSKLRIQLVGGGAAGGGITTVDYGAAGGGAGGYCDTIVSCTPSQSVTITVGAGGTGSSSTGGAGGTTSVVATGFDVYATGGIGGGPGASGNSAGGNPGQGFSAAIAIYGGYGGDGQTLPSNASFGGNGGASFFGGGGRGGAGGGLAGVAPGSGGGGAYGASTGNGGAGAPGFVLLEY